MTKLRRGFVIMINEVLAAIQPVLSERVLILLPNESEPDLVIYNGQYKATVKFDSNLPVFVVVNRNDGSLLTWGEGLTVTDATRQAMSVLESSQVVQRAA